MVIIGKIKNAIIRYDDQLNAFVVYQEVNKKTNEYNAVAVIKRPTSCVPIGQYLDVSHNLEYNVIKINKAVACINSKMLEIFNASITTYYQK